MSNQFFNNTYIEIPFTYFHLVRPILAYNVNLYFLHNITRESEMTSGRDSAR